MKLISIMLFAACIQVSARGVSQTLTITLKNASLEKVFSEIQKQTGYSFFYEDGLLKNARHVDITVIKASIVQVLDICFTNQPFTYKIVNNAVSVRKKEQVVQVLFQPAATTTGDPVTVSGKVTDPQGNPLPGANVKVRGTNIGATTDNNGNFVLKGVSENAVLEITFVGHEMKTFTVQKAGFVNIALEQKLSVLDEALVIAYGTTSRRFTTGNIATVKAEDIEKAPVQNPLLALQGRVPGIEVRQLTGLPGGAVSVRIQGQNSISAGLDPLIVIDGVPFPSQLFASNVMEGIVQQGSPLNYINPADIESIDVLKDADATAIYGSRAANGAILITTKKGKAGRTKLSINGQQGWGKVTRKVEMMNTRQYLDMRYEAYKNDGIDMATLSPDGSNYDLTVWDTTRYTNWQKELIGGTAQYTNLNVGMSGGTAALQYLVGATYNRQTTVFPGDFDDKMGTLHFSINGASPNQRLKMQLTGNYSYNQNHLLIQDLTSYAVLMEPNAPALFKEDGTLNWAPDGAGNSTWINPLAYTANTDYNNTTKNLVSNLNLSYRLLPGLEIRSSVGYTNTASELYTPIRLEYYTPESRPNSTRMASFGNRNMSSWIVEPQLQYTGQIGKGKMEALLGATIQKNSANALFITGSGFANDLLMKTLRAATAVTIDGSASSINRFNALFGRLNYNWADKYLVNLTARRDGSNKFGDQNKFHNFGSIGLGWIFSQENLLQKNLSFLSFGKLRGSYGTTGNDQVADFAYLSIYQINNPSILYQNGIGLNAVNIPNPYLQWEETQKLQGGIDLGFVHDRLIMGITYAHNRSYNQLLGYVLPSLTGFNAIAQNIPATIRNTSWEFTLNTVNVKSAQFTWSSNANLTIGRNRLLRFPGIETTPYADGYSGVIVGQPLGVIKLTHYAGLDPATGQPLRIDENGEPSYTNPAKRDVLLSNLTKFYGGIENSISYHGFQLDFLIQFERKKDTRDLFWYNGQNPPGLFSSGASNQPVSAKNRWQKPGDMGPIPPYSTMYSVNFGIYNGSDAGYSFDASYVRLKNVSVSWQLPTGWLKKTGLQNARIYAHGQNLLTITQFTGLDPETMSINTLPPLRMITVGGQIDF